MAAAADEHAWHASEEVAKLLAALRVKHNSGEPPEGADTSVLAPVLASADGVDAAFANAADSNGEVSVAAARAAITAKFPGAVRAPYHITRDPGPCRSLRCGPRRAPIHRALHSA